MKKNRIVRILAASALLILSVAATSFAAVGDKEVDLSVGFATEPVSGIGSGFGFSVGGGLEMFDISAISGSTLQVRGDIGYNSWSSSEDVGFGSKVDLEVTRIPVSAGARLYVPIEAVNNLRVYGEASLELSFDEVKIDLPAEPSFGIPAISETESETNFGLAPAVGVEYAVTPNIIVGGALKYHLVSDGYLNASVGVAYKF